MSTPGTLLTLAAINNYGNTTLTGNCTVPGVQSGHKLKITIFNTATPPQDISSQYTISAPTIAADGQWLATISPRIDRGLGYTIEVSCTHDGNTITATFDIAFAVNNTGV